MESTYLKIDFGYFLDPFLMNQISAGIEARVIDDQMIEVLDKSFPVKGSITETFGEELSSDRRLRVVYRNGWYCVEPWSRAERKSEQWQKQQDERDRLIRTKLDAAREDAYQFNSSLELPFPWTPAIKDVLSGLSENSWGDGRNQRTVVHIMIQSETFEKGRLKRVLGDFLCTKERGKRWSDSPEEFSVDGEGNTYPSKVTCKSCIKVAKRIIEAS